MPEAGASLPDAPQVGGSFAPPLDPEKLKSYREAAKDAPPQVAEAMETLARMADAYHARPRPRAGVKAPAGVPHPSGAGVVRALPKEEVDRLFDAVPWREELDMYAKLFDAIDPAGRKGLRDAAFHLLWLGYELVRDREPIFSDRL